MFHAELIVMIGEVQLTKQPSSEEWHIAVDPCLTEYMLIDEASRACAKTNRRLTHGLTIYFEFDNARPRACLEPAIDRSRERSRL